MANAKKLLTLLNVLPLLIAVGETEKTAKTRFLIMDKLADAERAIQTTKDAVCQTTFPQARDALGMLGLIEVFESLLLEHQAIMTFHDSRKLLEQLPYIAAIARRSTCAWKEQKMDKEVVAILNRCFALLGKKDIDQPDTFPIAQNCGKCRSPDQQVAMESSDPVLYTNKERLLHELEAHTVLLSSPLREAYIGLAKRIANFVQEIVHDQESK